MTVFKNLRKMMNNDMLIMDERMKTNRLFIFLNEYKILRRNKLHEICEGIDDYFIILICRNKGSFEK